MTYTARHTASPARNRALRAIRATAAMLAIVVAFLGLLVLSTVSASPTVTRDSAPTMATTQAWLDHFVASVDSDPRCYLTTLTDAQCAAGFADNGINGDH